MPNNNKGIIQNIQQRVFGKKLSDDDTQIRMLLLVKKSFNLSWDELMNLYIPTYKYLVNIIEKESESKK